MIHKIMTKKTILVVGGVHDQEIIWIIERLEHSQKFNIIKCLLEKDVSPEIEWDFDNDKLYFNNNEINPSIVWLRQDVFQNKYSLLVRGKRWQQFIQGWLLVHQDVVVVNRKWLNQYSNKLFNLSLAKKIGLKIPSTIITNSITKMEKLNEQTKQNIIKPIDNGFCESLDDILDRIKETNIKKIAPSPAFIQEKLQSSEIRMYWIGGEIFIFKIKCDTLDYRKLKSIDVEIKQVSTNSFDNGFLIKIGKLMGLLELDFGAIDFKYNEEKELIFLEVNDFPMFSYFDKICNNKLSNKIIELFE